MPLVDSDLWQEKFLPLKQLTFHPRNPRLPELPENASEAEIIHALCLTEHIDRLAATIAEKGWLRNDRLIVVKDDGLNVVYEGNRRLCALKVLTNPKLAPAKQQAAFMKLASAARLPKKIGVDVVPNRFDAEIVMYSKHAIDAYVERWAPLQKAMFIASKIEDGTPMSIISAQYLLPKDEIIEAKNAIDFFRIARVAKLSEKARQLVDDPQQFPYSTVFERLVKPTASRKELGIEFTEAGMIVHNTKENFLPVVEKILEDAANNKIDTRKLNTRKDQIDYVRKLGVKKAKGSFTAEDAEQNALQRPTAIKKNAAKKVSSRSSIESPYLLPSSLTVKSENAKIIRIVAHGKKLKIADQFYAGAALLRLLLEIGLIGWLKHHKKFNQVSVSNLKHGPSLNDMLDFVNKNRVALHLDSDVGTALESLISRKVKESKSQLDRIVHGVDVTTTPEEVATIRDQAIPLLRSILLTK